MIYIVLPILTLLMFDLGLTLSTGDFKTLVHQPKALIIGLIGQLIVLPAIAFLLAELFNLNALFYIGLVLIACCPGGSSSNIFSKIAKGDVALSITLTAISSIVTMFTIPLILSLALRHSPDLSDTISDITTIKLPVGNLLIQNIILMFIPILSGFAMRHLWPNAALKTDQLLSKIAFPALMLLAGIFFIQHHKTIGENIATLGIVITILIIAAISASALLSYLAKLQGRQRKTIIIEVGMQNAAQAIAIASSPFIFGCSALAIPAIIYALLMNLILLLYVATRQQN